jgi:membrane protein DedA with SNARE-associated domain
MGNTPTLIDHYLTVAQPFLNHYGYAAIFGLVLVESFGVPAPGEAIIIAGSLLASRGQMNIVVILTLAWVAAVVGDNIGFAIGHFGGRRLIAHRGRYIGIKEHHLAKVERFFERYGGGIVVFARFIQVLRQLNGLVAGTMGMPWWRFLFFNALGAALWVGAWGGGIYFLGKHMEAALDVLSVIEPYLIGAGVMALLLGAVYILRRIKNNNAE